MPLVPPVAANRADRLVLSRLHRLGGRIGGSDRRARASLRHRSGATLAPIAVPRIGRNLPESQRLAVARELLSALA